MSMKETPGQLSAKNKIDLYSNKYFGACLLGGVIGEREISCSFQKLSLT